MAIGSMSLMGDY